MFAPNISLNSPSNSHYPPVEYVNWLAWPEAEALAFWYWSHLSWANFRAAFYLIGPSESTFSTVKDVPDYTIQVSAWWSLLLLLEFALLWLTGHSERVALNDSICSISAGILSQLFRSSGRTFCLSIYVWIWENWRLLDLDANSPWIWAACLVSQDFAYYLGHRAMHEINLLWAFHSAHHSSEFLNLSTALRQPLLQDLGLAPFELLQAFLLPPPLFLVHRYFSHIYQFWLHTSLLGSLGPLGFFLNSPAFHRVHHAQNAYCLDRNFGALFIIWDRIFGTFQGEKPEERPLQYGLANVDGPASFDQIKIQFLPIKMTILDNFYGKGENFGLKMRKLYWPPGWSPGQKTKQFFHWRSLIRPKGGELAQKQQYFPLGHSNIARRHKNLPLYLKAYLLFHFLLLLTMFLHFQYNRLEMDWNEFGLKIAFFMLSIWILGAFFDQNKIAPFVECNRCLGFCLYHFHQYRHFPLQFSSIVLITIFALSSTIFGTKPIFRMWTKRNQTSLKWEMLGKN